MNNSLQVSKTKYNFLIKAKSIFLLVLMIGLVYLAYAVFMRIASVYYLNETQVYLNKWERNGIQGIDFNAQHAAAKDAIESSLYYSKQAYSLERAALVNMWALNNMPFEKDAERIELQALTERLFKEALTIKPVWPYTWSNYALFKAQQTMFDDGFSSALKLSKELGPHEKNVQLTLLQIGFSSWDHLKPKDKRIILDTIKHSFTQSSQQVIHLARSHKRMDIVCLILKNMHEQRALFTKNCTAKG